MEEFHKDPLLLDLNRDLVISIINAIHTLRIRTFIAPKGKIVVPFLPFCRTYIVRRKKDE